MAEKSRLSLMELIVLSSLLTGISGADGTHVFFSSGENVRLSCNKALPGCRSTTWIYNSNRFGQLELFALGIKQTGTERLSLGSDCSLNIRNITAEDSGSYVCKQYGNGHGKDEHVYLHVLHVSSEISPVSLTLSCRLYSYNQGSCEDVVRSEGFRLSWVNEAGVDLKTDSRCQISFSSSDCISTLRTTLLNEEDSREWRCQLIGRDRVQTSARYSLHTPAQAQKLTPAITVILVISVLAAACSLFHVVWVIWRKISGNQRGTGDSAVKEENDGNYYTIDAYVPPTPRANEKTEDMFYSLAVLPEETSETSLIV